MNEAEKKVYVTNKLNDKITLDEIYNFLPYTSKDLTHKIIKFVLNNFEWNYTNLKVIKEYARIDKPFLEELANEWCEGKYIDKVQNVKQLYNFEGTFALTKWWLPVTEYSKNVFSQLFI